MHPLYTLTTQTLSHTSDPIAMALPDCSALPEKDSGPHYTTKTAQECQEKHKEYKALIWRKLSQIPIIHRGPSSQPTKLKGSATKALVPDATWNAKILWDPVSMPRWVRDSLEAQLLYLAYLAGGF